MSLWSFLFGWWGSDIDTGITESPSFSNDLFENHGCDINPATGLPMVGGCGGVDVAGNPYGADLHDDTWSPMSDSLSDDIRSSSGHDSSSSCDSWSGSSWDD